MTVLKDYSKLLKPNTNETNWTKEVMDKAVIDGYLFYYWAMYTTNEQDRREVA